MGALTPEEAARRLRDLDVDALLLDLDGTLVDSEPVHREGWRRFFTRRGWDHDDELISLFTGRRADDVFASTPGPWQGEDPVALYHEAAACVPHDLAPEPVAGVRALLDRATERDVPLALVTSAGPEWADRALDVVGGADRFRVLVTRDDVTAGKPAPDGYELAVHRLAVDPARCLAAEDTPAGIESARAARAGTVVGLATTFPAEELLRAGADLVVTDWQV